MFAYNGTTSSSVVTTDNPLSTSSYQLIEEQFLPGTTHGTGTIFVNQTQHVQSTSMVASLNNITRSANVLGAAIGGTSGYFKAVSLKCCLFGRSFKLTKASIASYVLSKYGIEDAHCGRADIQSRTRCCAASAASFHLARSKRNSVVYA